MLIDILSIILRALLVLACVELVTGLLLVALLPWDVAQRDRKTPHDAFLEPRPVSPPSTDAAIVRLVNEAEQIIREAQRR